MARPPISGVAAALAALVLVPTTAGQTGASPPAGTGAVRLNEVQAIGTHNSYKRELSEVEQAEYDEIIATQTCVLFVTCLRQVEAWSDANPAHVPLTILLELKQSDSRAVANGGVVAPPWDAAALDALDAEIRSVFDEADFISPDDVRRPGLTLEQSIRTQGWPTLADGRGQVILLLDNDPGPIRTISTAGRPNLEGPRHLHELEGRANRRRVHQAQRAQGREHGADPGAGPPGLPRAHALRLPLSTVRSGDTEMLEAALASGAHVISTDFPEV
jgi:Phosphoinositide phospholipase C, Ca2+-dependent